MRLTYAWTVKCGCWTDERRKYWQGH